MGILVAFIIGFAIGVFVGWFVTESKWQGRT